MASIEIKHVDPLNETGNLLNYQSVQLFIEELEQNLYPKTEMSSILTD